MESIMSKLTRTEIFEKAAKKLRSDFDELSTVPHRGLKGSAAERLIRVFLDQHLPKRFATGSGFIIDRNDNVSKQTDVLIYDAFNCPVYRASDESGIYPNDNVAAVIEVKSLLDKDRLVEAYQNIGEAKRLAKTRSSEYLPFPVQEQTLGCLFAFKSAITLDTICDHYHNLLAEKNVLGDHIDIIAVLDEGVITFMTKGNHGDWGVTFISGSGGPQAEGSHIALCIQELGQATLDVFLRLLLTQLILFRGIVDHPGLELKPFLPGGYVRLKYLASITHEQDPVKKKEILDRYREEVKKELSNTET
jgi:uncharacterized protein DUF6602